MAHPSAVLPVLPPPTVAKSFLPSAPAYLILPMDTVEQKRRELYAQFLNICAQHPVLGNDENLRRFLEGSGVVRFALLLL